MTVAFKPWVWAWLCSMAKGTHFCGLNIACPFWRAWRSLTASIPRKCSLREVVMLVQRIDALNVFLRRGDSFSKWVMKQGNPCILFALQGSYSLPLPAMSRCHKRLWPMPCSRTLHLPDSWGRTKVFPLWTTTSQVFFCPLRYWHTMILLSGWCCVIVAVVLFLETSFAVIHLALNFRSSRSCLLGAGTGSHSYTRY